MMNSVQRVSINWRNPNCGGASIHGTASCEIEPASGVVKKCCCESLNPFKEPKNFDYGKHYLFAQSVFGSKMHLNKNCTDWDSFTMKLFDTGALSGFKPVLGAAMKDRFFKKMVQDVSMRHCLTDSTAGYETHPDLVTPYDSIMLRMVKELKDQQDKLDLLTKKEEQKQKERSSKLGEITNKYCPPINDGNAKGVLMDLTGGDEIHADNITNLCDDANLSDSVGEPRPKKQKMKIKIESSTSSFYKNHNDLDYAQIKEIMKPDPELIELEREKLKLERKKLKNEARAQRNASNMLKLAMAREHIVPVSSSSSDDEA